MKNAAFTLIELLVVVLIIGILSAIALPQYQTAVMKARFATLMPIVKALADAQEIYYIANGQYAQSVYELDVQPPAGFSTSNDGLIIQYNGFHCSVLTSGTRVYCTGDNYGYMSRFLHHDPDFPDTNVCRYYRSNSALSIQREKLCKSFGGKDLYANSDWGWAAWTIP